MYGYNAHKKNQGFFFYLSIYLRLAEDGNIFRSYPFSLWPRGAKQRTQTQWQEFLGVGKFQGSEEQTCCSHHSMKEACHKKWDCVQSWEPCSLKESHRIICFWSSLELNSDFLLSAMSDFSMAILEPGHSLHVPSWLTAMGDTLR